MIVELISRGSNVSSGLITRRHLYSIDQTFFEPFWCNVFPIGTAVTGQIDQAIVAARPDHSFFMRRLYDVTERSIIFCADGLIGVWTTGPALLLFFIAREIWRDLLPRDSHIAGFQKVLGSMIKSTRLVFAPNDRCIPVEAVLDVFCIHSQILNRCGHHVGTGLGLNVEYLDRSLVAVAHDKFWIVRIKGE